MRIATATLTQRHDGILALLGRQQGGSSAVDCVSVCVCTVCACVCGWVYGHLKTEESLKHSRAEWSERKHDRVTPLLPFMLSELSVRPLERMRSNDTLFVSAKQD